MEKFGRCELRLYRMEILSDLRVGAGEGSEELPATDILQKKQRRFIRNEKGELEEVMVPYIPGESLYGAIRASIESFCRGKNVTDDYENWNKEKQDAFNKLYPKKEKQDAFNNLYTNKELEKFRIYAEVCNPLIERDKCEDLTGKEDKKKFLKLIERETPCQVCKIYGYGGAGGHIGKLSITAAFPEKKLLEKNILQDHTNISIDRNTGTAADKALRDSETIIPGSYFYFFVKFTDLEEDEIKNKFDSAIDYLSSVGSIGSGKTKGRGMINIEKIFAWELNKKLFEDKDFQSITSYEKVKAKKLDYISKAEDLPYYERVGYKITDKCIENLKAKINSQDKLGKLSEFSNKGFSLEEIKQILSKLEFPSDEIDKILQYAQKPYYTCIFPPKYMYLSLKHPDNELFYKPKEKVLQTEGSAF